MKTVRVWFSKTGVAKYISHLDLTRCMSRALKLSKLPVWYTEGFNPHIYMTFAMPLSLGVEGLRECMDIRLTEDMELSAAARQLAEHLPKDISVLEITEPVLSFDATAFAEYELCFDSKDPQALADVLDEILSLDSIIVMKHSKKGDKEFDIKPHFALLDKQIEPVLLRVKLQSSCSQEGSVNPSLLLEAVKQYKGLEPYAEITRIKLLAKDFSDMR
ncbi:TIGR03936 family radical SAM-associated protein [Acutalibacter sp. 1XD8-36]|uniref:TIGR03936 family radical SAM-associated protein n=1 Tax=Acutalibacter sp. 1XD8-36 TaxID=2320852 RepID=UPI0014128733|nr:TIGR03936 family radical SAM-associated protein [Acutalibacter sp. 1XD8-36]